MTIRFTRDHEWIRVDGDQGVVGITDYAQKQLGDVVFVELPEVGAQLRQGEQAGVVESVKAASEVYAPTSGQVTAINKTLVDEPAKVNLDALGDGWFFRLELSDASEVDELLDEQGYHDYLATLD